MDNEVKESPILFSGPMVRAILEGRKTQTRRVVKLPTDDHNDWQPAFPFKGTCQFNNGPSKHRSPCDLPIKCPYGQPGDRLWVRETFAFYGDEDRYVIHYRADMPERMGPWTPSIHMPRKYCRLVLEVKAVRVERLQDIKRTDCYAEGLEVDNQPMTYNGEPAQERFAALWDSLNAKRGYGWDENPWVWVVEFEVIES